MAIKFGSIESRQPTQLQIAAAYRAFRVSTGAIAAPGTSEFPLLLLQNPGSNPVPLSMLMKKVAALTVGQTAAFKLYLNPTVSAVGTPITPVNLRLNAAAPASAALAYMQPTVSSNGTEFEAAFATAQDVFPPAPCMLDPGQSILVTATASNAGELVKAALVYGEGV